MSVAGYDMEIWSDDAYTSTESNVYWVTFPTKTKTSSIYVAPLSCTGTFSQTDAEGYTRTLLTLSESSNGPQYFYETAAANQRIHYTSGDKLYMNYNMLDFEFNNGEEGIITIRQRMRYGMGQDSWCLVRIPTYWEIVEDTEVTTSSAWETDYGNMTEITHWEVTTASNTEETLYLVYHGQDVWPHHTNDFRIENLKAPYG